MFFGFLKNIFLLFIFFYLFSFFMLLSFFSFNFCTFYQEKPRKCLLDRALANAAQMLQ